MSADLGSYWIRVAVIHRGRLSPAKIFPPGATVTVGARPNNDFAFPGCGVESLPVVQGASVCLIPGAEVRMAGHGQCAARCIAAGDTQRVVVVDLERVNVTVVDGLRVLINYHPTREDAEVVEERRRRAEIPSP